MTELIRAALMLATLASPASADEIQVVKSGKVYGSVYGYRVGEDFYLGAEDAAKIYGGSLYWRPVQGRVQISLRGKQAVFSTDSDEANVAGSPVRMGAPMIVRAGQALIPTGLFSSREFSRMAGFETKFNSQIRLLSVSDSLTVGPVRWFTYADYTRIVLELQDGLRYRISRRGVGGLDVAVIMGMASSEEQRIGDGAVEDVALGQEAQLSRLSIRLQEGAKDWKSQELSDPRRLVIDVFRKSPLKELPPRRESASPPAQPPAPPEEAAKKEIAAQHEAPAQPDSAQPAPPPPAAAKPAPGVRRIVVDAGHGGKDSGAVGRGVREKDINLRAAKELARMLKEKGRFDVLLTRDSDFFVPLGDRSRKANEFNADLFISLHCNAHRSRSETGYEVYFQSERASDPEAERLAEFENSVLSMESKVEDDAANLLYALARTEFINDSAKLAGLMTKSLAGRVDLPNRGVKQAAFYVLRGANEPAVLVEMGFVSNPKDAGKLESLSYRKRLIEGLYAGIVEFARAKESGARGPR